ncbi:MAG: SCP2 sterol-binding domain-containing protein [bacterium]|nr:SCP2 sterol-binding domain-containing protein [bacterium]
MSAFRDSAHLRDVIGGFFRQEAAVDDHMFAGSGVIIAYKLREPDVRFVLDASVKPAPGRAFEIYLDDPQAPEAQVEISMDADTFDQLYRGQVQAMALMMTGKAKAKGDITIAMRMLPAMARVIPHYKTYRETH